MGVRFLSPAPFSIKGGELSISNLRQLLKEYLELDDPTIEEFIKSFEGDWKLEVGKVLSDKKADDLLNKLIGTSKLIKAQ